MSVVDVLTTELYKRQQPDSRHCGVFLEAHCGDPPVFDPRHTPLSEQQMQHRLICHEHELFYDCCRAPG
jgi:hypothetical protein